MFQILSTSNIVDKNIVDNNWRGMKILSIHPNVGHSKSGRKLSPRVDNLFMILIGKKTKIMGDIYIKINDQIC